jgi:hypothetical protein
MAGLDGMVALMGAGGMPQLQRLLLRANEITGGWSTLHLETFPSEEGTTKKGLSTLTGEPRP